MLTKLDFFAHPLPLPFKMRAFPIAKGRRSSITLVGSARGAHTQGGGSKDRRGRRKKGV